MKDLTGQNKRLNRSKNENAITLVALIITIIILIILAAVTINSLTHEGLADMAIKGTQDYDKAQSDEMNMLNEIDTMVKETVKNLEESKITWVTSSDNVKVPVPTGYTLPTIDAEKSVDGGYVIKDPNQNEWVWVPVDEATYNSMFVTETVALSGSTGVSTAKYSASNIISGTPRVKPRDTSNYREPDLVTGTGTDNDANAKTAGFSSLQDMATKMTSEYSTMLESIQKYGGFYIGRYELTANGSKSGTPLVASGRNWYDLYKKCTELSTDNTKATTRMIWRMPVGCNM